MALPKPHPTLGNENEFRLDARRSIQQLTSSAEIELMLRRCTAQHFGVRAEEVEISGEHGWPHLVACPVRRPNLTMTRVVRL